MELTFDLMLNRTTIADTYCNDHTVTVIVQCILWNIDIIGPIIKKWD